MSTVRSVDLEQQTVVTDGGPVHWDYLVMAAGSATNFFGNEAIRARAFEIKDLDHAIDVRNHILTLFERAASTPVGNASRMVATAVSAARNRVDCSASVSSPVSMSVDT